MYARDDDIAWLQGARLIDSSQLLAYRVVADAGMGKTRLIQEFLERAKLEGDVTVLAGPYPYGAEVAFHTLREAIYGLTGIRPGSGARREWRDAREDEQRGLNEIFGVSEGQRSLPPTQRRDDIDAAFRWALDRATARARGARVILAIEDLERALALVSSERDRLHLHNDAMSHLLTHARWQQALPHLDVLVAAHPQDPTFLAYRATAYCKLDQRAHAARDEAALARMANKPLPADMTCEGSHAAKRS